MGLGLARGREGEHIEGAIDVGLSLYSLGVTLDGAEGVHTTGISPTPAVALTVPIKTSVWVRISWCPTAVALTFRPMVPSASM